jgi:hypothetical protein
MTPASQRAIRVRRATGQRDGKNAVSHRGSVPAKKCVQSGPKLDSIRNPNCSEFWVFRRGGKALFRHGFPGQKRPKNEPLPGSPRERIRSALRRPIHGPRRAASREQKKAEPDGESGSARGGRSLGGIDLIRSRRARREGAAPAWGKGFACATMGTKRGEFSFVTSLTDRPFSFASCFAASCPHNSHRRYDRAAAKGNRFAPQPLPTDYFLQFPFQPRRGPIAGSW